jgi:hypothetical protein
VDGVDMNNGSGFGDDWKVARNSMGQSDGDVNNYVKKILKNKI